MPIPAEAKDAVERILSGSALSEEDKALWRERLESIAETYTYLFLDLFEEDQSELQKETDRLKEKLAAKGDEEKMRGIISREAAELKEAMQTNIQEEGKKENDNQ